MARALGASCNTPLGAHAYPAGCGCLRLRAWVGLPDGSEWVGDELSAASTTQRSLGGVWRRLKRRREILRGGRVRAACWSAQRRMAVEHG